MTKLRRARSALWALVCLALAPVQAGENRWTVEGPFGGYVESIAIAASDQDIVYLATSAGLHRSDDGGLTWTMINSQLTNGPGRNMFVDPSDADRLIVAHDQDGFNVSTDGGVTFTERLGLPSPRIRSAARAADGRYYVGLDADGVWVTADEGLTWQEINTGLPPGQSTLHPQVAFMAVARTDPNRVILTFRTVGPVYYTSDGGLNWSPATVQPPTIDPRDIDIDPFDADHALLVNDFDLFESLDGGATWTEITPTPPLPSSIAFDQGVVDRVFMGGFLGSPSGGMFRSDDGGRTWNQESALGPREYGLVGPIAAPPNGGGWILADADHVYRRSADGSAWTRQHDGILGNGQELILASPDQPGVLYANVNPDLAVSADAGATWTEIVGTPPNELPVLGQYPVGAIDPQDGSNIFLFNLTDTDLYFTSDSGENWAVRSTVPGGAIISFDVIPTSPLGFVVGGISGNIARSDDAGLTWTLVPSISTGVVSRVAVQPGNSDVILIGDIGGHVFRTADGGATWTEVTPGPVNFGFVEFDPHEPDTAYLGSANFSDPAWRSTDGGATWAQWPGTPQDNLLGLAFDPQAAGILYLSTFDTPYRSIDNGQTWESFDERDLTRLDGLAGPSQLVIDPLEPYRLYGATAAGVATYEFARDLAVSWSTASATVTLAQQATYSAEVTNAGPGLAARIEVSLPVPANATLIAASAGGGDCAADATAVTCTRNQLGDGQTFNIDLTFQPTAFGPITVSAEASSLERELNPADNSAGSSAVTVVPADVDGDGVGDSVDNCVFVANADQRDTNGDGYGNICDADLNDDGTVNFPDLMLLRAVFFGTDEDADFNGDGMVNFADLQIMKQSLFGPPGPSGPFL